MLLVSSPLAARACVRGGVRAQPGNELIAAGYALYDAATVLVLTTGLVRAACDTM
jgi:fructose-1,6-bisphosphatase